MDGCSVCGSTRAALSVGRCVAVPSCERRRIARRIEEDRKRGGRQCMVSRGSATIRFCIMREGHGGRHTDGGREFGREEETAVGRVFAEVMRPKRALSGG